MYRLVLSVRTEDFMEVIIIGCGKVGVTLADQLVREDHNVVMVDTFTLSGSYAFW